MRLAWKAVAVVALASACGGRVGVRSDPTSSNPDAGGLNPEASTAEGSSGTGCTPGLQEASHLSVHLQLSFDNMYSWMLNEQTIDADDVPVGDSMSCPPLL